MNRILTLGVAAAGTVLLSQPVYADHRGGGGGGHAAAPAVHAAPAVRSAPAPHFSTHAMAPEHFVQRSAPMPHYRSADIHPRTNFAPSVAQSQFRAQRNSPSIAFGGSTVNNNAFHAQNARTFANTGPANGRGSAGFRPPGGISRDWDHGRIHEWRHHHYRWYGGDWVLFDDAPYGYSNDYGYPPYDNDYDEPPPAVMYDSSASMAASVQSQLDSQGYNAGPADGVVGPQTRDAISDFQYSHHLPVSGQIDDPLLRALGLR